MPATIEALSQALAAEEYLRALLGREAVDTSLTSPVLRVRAELMPVLRAWGGQRLIDAFPSGSFAKGTAIRSGTDVDLLLSLVNDTPETLREIHDSLFHHLQLAGYAPRRQNVSINIRAMGYSVDLVPARRHRIEESDHSLYVRRSDTWIKTNIAVHIAYIRSAGRQNETRILKLWRNQKRIDLPSFYLEMIVIRALAERAPGYLSRRVTAVFEFLRDRFENARFVDPANSNNVLSDGLTAKEKRAIAAAATRALAASNWQQVVA